MAPRGNDSTRYGRNGADHAVTMLERLLARTTAFGLVCGVSVHDMAMTSEAIDNGGCARGSADHQAAPRG